MSGPKRQPGDLERVLNVLVNASVPITQRELSQTLRLHPRVVFECISLLDGSRILLGGNPNFGYQLAAFREDGSRRDRALESLAREIRERLRRRRKFARKLPPRPAP